MGNSDRARAVSALVYAIGHSSRSAESFLEMLRHYDITCLVDVRRYPGSRRHPHFNRGTLEARGRGYQTQINALLRAYMEAHES